MINFIAMKLFRRYKKIKQYVRLMQNIATRFNNTKSWEEHRTIAHKYFKLLGIYNNNFSYFFCSSVDKSLQKVNPLFEKSADKSMDYAYNEYINNIIDTMREEEPAVRYEIYQKYIVNHTFYKNNKRAVDCLTNEQIIELTRLL